MADFELSGVLIVNKPTGMTSHDVVNRIRKLYNTKKVGHTGTLDPMASGVLVVLVGRAVKASELLVSDSKEYVAGLKLGVTTDTQDITGSILSEHDGALPIPEEIKKILPSFTGKIMQTPPMYSALKIGGKKLYELARQGQTVEREAREIGIEELEYLAKGKTEDEHIIRVVCSKGTYIRTLCEDIGSALGCGGTMSSLLRTRNGAFTLENSHTIEELEEMDEDGRIRALLETESVFSELAPLSLAPFFEKLARCGNEIYLKKLGMSLPVGTLVRLCGGNGFFAVGEVRSYPDGDAVKPIKQFDI